jgi:glycosyltransferase involved in cell wall biosynthesis
VFLQFLFIKHYNKQETKNFKISKQVEESPILQKSKSQIYLTIMIPTMKRENYLTKTLTSLKKDLVSEDLFHSNIEFFIFNNEKISKNEEFYELKEKEKNPKFNFIEGNQISKEKSFQQQTLDIVSNLDYMIRNVDFKLILFIEDDFTLCPNGNWLPLN